MMIDTCLLCASLDALFDEVNKIGGAKLTETGETVCSCIDSKTDIFVFYDSKC